MPIYEWVGKCIKTLPDATTYLAYVPVFVDIVVYTRSLSWNSVTWRPFWTIIPVNGFQNDALSHRHGWFQCIIWKSWLNNPNQEHTIYVILYLSRNNPTGKEHQIDSLLYSLNIFCLKSQILYILTFLMWPWLWLKHHQAWVGILVRLQQGLQLTSISNTKRFWIHENPQIVSFYHGKKVFRASHGVS